MSPSTFVTRPRPSLSLPTCRRRSERGSVTIWMLLWTPVLVLCIGAIVDYGAAIQTRALAADVALGTARAGAVQVVSVTGEGPEIDSHSAVAAAAAYVAEAQRRAPAGVELTATYEPTVRSMTVTVTARYQPRLLRTVDGTFTRTETAELRVGQ